MATTTQTFTGTGSQTQFSIAFSYRTTADVKATINAVATTAFSVSGSTVTFTSAPANGAAVVIFRETTNDTIEADFQSGSALRAVDLNDNFEQLLFVTQESTNTAATAETNSNTAVSTANTASTNASNAVTTANSAATDAATAISTANSATTTANSATATANAATTTANTASSNATAAVNTANTASSNATAAVNTANTASTNATAAVNTANTASSNATTAVNTANAATTTANAASAAVANAVLYDPVANVAAIPGSPSDGDYVEVQDSTGIQSFSPLSGMPSGFVGDSGLVVRLKYVTSPSTTWQWQNYFAKDSETRYLKDNAAQIVDADINASAAIGLSKLATGALPSGITVASANITDGTIVDADISGSAAIGLSKLATGALPTAITVTSANISDLSIVNADVNASAAIAGTKISPDFGSQNVTTTGTGTFSGTVQATDGTQYVKAYETGFVQANRTNGSNFVFEGRLSNSTTSSIKGNGSAYFASNVGIGTASPSRPLSVSSSQIGARFTSTSSDSQIEVVDSNGTVVYGSTSGNAIVQAGGSERLRIDGSGRVGIANTTMSSFTGNSSDNLVVGGGSGSEGITVYSAAQGSLTFADGTSGNAAYRGAVEYNHTADQLAFRTAGTGNRMVIDSSGRVLIGTTTEGAADADNLTIADSGDCGITIRTGTTSTGAIYFSDATSGTGEADGFIDYNQSSRYLRFGTAQGERLRIDSSGRLGINSSTPEERLHVNGAIVSTSSNSTSSVGGSNRAILDLTSGGARIGHFRGTTSAGSGYLGLFVDSSERLRIDSSGNVGIGTTSPGAKLHATGEIRFGSNTSYYGSLDHDAASTGANIYNSVDSGGHIFKRNNTIEQMRIASSGNVGIGSSNPADKLQVNGSGTTAGDGAIVARFYDSAQSKGLFLGYDSNEVGGTIYGANLLTFQTYNGTSWGERMRISSSGLVGIGANNNTSYDSAAQNLLIADESGNTGITIRSGGGTPFGSIHFADGISNNDEKRAGRIMYGHSGDFFSFITANSERLRIDSSGRLLAGTTTPGDAAADNLTLHSSGDTGITIRAGESDSSSIYFADGTGGTNVYTGAIIYDHATNHMSLHTNSGAERLRIDGSGNVALGRTSASSRLDLQAASGRTQITLRNVGNTSDASTFVAAEEMTSGNADLIMAARHNVRFFSNLNEKMRIDSAGNVGIGEASPSSNLVVKQSGSTFTTQSQTVALFQRSSTTGHGAKIAIVSGNAASSDINFGDTDDEDVGLIQYVHTDNSFRFKTNTAERMRIASNGNVLFGKTTSGDTSAFGIEFYSGSTGGLHITNATSDAGSRVLAINRQSGNGEAIEFRRANTEVGSITVTTSATAYNTSSDYRLKENVVDITDGITRVKQLQPKRFNFIADADTTVDGFIAHEAQTVVPEAVTGTHNEVDDDGNAVMQGIDQSKLVPLLTAALQEAIAKIETLEAKVAALEAA